MARFTTATLKKKKKAGEKIVMLTAYDYPFAKLVDSAGADMILVGDSLGQVVLGYDDTTRVTMEDMLHHTKAVMRGAEHAMVVTDLPFLSYHTSDYDAVVNAGRLIREGGAQAVKLEGGRDFVSTIAAIVRAQIPVVGHLGLTPQSIHQLGGYFIQGKTDDAAQKLLDDAKAVEEAGACALVLECVPAPVAKRVTEALSIPTIGIGAGPDCDGQVLVSYDMLGLYPKKVAKFVKPYANLSEPFSEAVKAYADEVRSGKFPTEEYSF